MWDFLDISVVYGNNRREYCESGLSQNQGPVATNVMLPFSGFLLEDLKKKKTKLLTCLF